MAPYSTFLVKPIDAGVIGLFALRESFDNLEMNGKMGL